MTERFRLGDHVVSRAGGGRAVVIRRDGGPPALVTDADAELISGCTRFATLDQHAESAGRRKPGSRDLARRRLGEFAAEDLLEPWSAVATGGPMSDTPREATRWLGFPTRDRPAVLERAVRSFAEGARRFGREQVIVVSDDSDDARVQSEVRARLARVAEDGADIRLIDHASVDQLVEAIAAASGVDVITVRSAVSGRTPMTPWTPGANYNRLLLALAGQRFQSFDDDTLCAVAPAPTLSSGAVVAGALDGTVFWPHRTRDEAFAAHPAADRDPCALHDDVLSPCPAAVIADQGGVPDFAADDLASPAFRAVRRGDARVVLSSLGVVGDSGMGSSSWYLHQRADTTARFAADDATWAWARRTRVVFRSTERTALSAGAHFMSMAFGLDATGLVPPFLPFLRAADQCFARLLRHIRDEALIAHLPWGIRHDPDGERILGEYEISEVLGVPSLSEAVDWVLETRGSGGPGDSEARLRGAGRACLEFAALSDDSLGEFARNRWFKRCGDYARLFDARLQRPPMMDGRPPCAGWRRDVERCVAVLHGIVARGEFPAIAHEVPRGADTLAVYRRALGEYGALLVVWPEILAAARAVHGDRGPIATPIPR